MSHADKSAATIARNKHKAERPEATTHSRSRANSPGAGPMPGSAPPGSDAYYGRAASPAPHSDTTGRGRPATPGAAPGSASYFGRAPARSAAGSAPAPVGPPPGSTAYFGGTPPAGASGGAGRADRGAAGVSRAPGQPGRPQPVGQPPGSAAYFGETTTDTPARRQR